MNFDFTPEQTLIRDTVRGWVEGEVRPQALKWDKTGEMDRTVVGALGDLGLLGAGIAEEYGGSPIDTVAYCLALEELGWGDSSVRGIVSVANGLCAKPIYRFGTEEQKQRFLPRLCSGAAVGCFALTEPDTGSDAAALSSRAVREGDDWLLSGSKMFITNGTWAEVAVAFARTDGVGPEGITAFIVPMDLPGVEATPIHDKLGLRSQDTASISFDQVRIPDDLRLGERGRGFSIAMSTVGRGRVSVAAGCVGVIRACLEEATRYTKQRHQFGRSLAGFQLVQAILADIAVELEAARLLTLRAAYLMDTGRPFEEAASKAKYMASEAAVRAANGAVQVHGGYGFIEEYPVAKLLRDARVLTLYEGTSQVQQLLIGRSLTGYSAFT